MKHLFITLMLVFLSTAYVQAQEAKASIQFDKTTHNFGSFPETDRTKECSFTFTNVGDAPLVISQVVASCGCTVPKYTKQPIQPGESGQIDVTYNTKGRFLGHFKKTLTVRTNGSPEVSRLYIEGTMTSATEKENDKE